MCLGHSQKEDLGAFLKGRVEGGELMKTEGKKPSSINYTRGAAAHKGYSEEGWLDAALAGTKRTRVRTGLQTGPGGVTVHRANENFQCMTAAAKVNRQSS